MLNDRELNTVLAALRLLQSFARLPDAILEIATNGGEAEPLDAEEIDALCERLNCAGELRADPVAQAARELVAAYGGDVPDWIRPEVQALAVALENERGPNTIRITIEGGCLRDVEGLPEGWAYELDDHDV